MQARRLGRGATPHSFGPQRRQGATAVGQGRPRGPTLWPQLKPPLDLLLLRAVVPAFRVNGPDPGLGPREGSSAAMKACRTATSLRDRETGRAGGKAQVNTARSGPHGLAGLLPKSWLEGTRRAPEGKGPTQHVQIVSPTQVGRWGWAGSQLFQPSSRQMVTLFLEFPAKWACGPSEVRRYTDTQVGS